MNFIGHRTCESSVVHYRHIHLLRYYPSDR